MEKLTFWLKITSRLSTGDLALRVDAEHRLMETEAFNTFFSCSYRTVSVNLVLATGFKHRRLDVTSNSARRSYETTQR